MVCGHCNRWRFPKRRQAQEFFEHRRTDCENVKWARVVQLRAEGNQDSADRVACAIMGVKKKEMKPEDRAQVDQYNVDHREEINLKKRQQRLQRRMHRDAAARHSRQLDRKRKGI